MKKENYDHFKPGTFVFWQRQRDGLYVIAEVQRRGNEPPLLFLERVYNTSYERETSNKKDREYQVDATFCKLVDLKDLLSFEEDRIKRVRTMVNSLSKSTQKSKWEVFGYENRESISPRER